MSAKWLILQATIVAGIELMGVSREGTSRHFSMMNKVSAVDSIERSLPPAAISLVFKAFYGFGQKLDNGNW
eukprot:scaffold22700_cov52-Cyclotella_meneghiniana.AAC.7